MPEEIQQIVADARAAMADPTGPYATRPDLREAAEARLAAVLLRANVPPPPAVTPESIAQASHEASFSLRDLPAGVTETIAERTADIAKLDKPAVDRMAAELREQFTPEVYDQLVRDAGSAATAAVKADAWMLKTLANHGRYLAAYEATKPGAKR